MAALGSPLMDDLFDTNSGVQIKRSSSFLDEGYWTPSSPSSEVGRQVRTSASIESLVSTINNAKPLVAVVGVGYVGLHLVDVFSSQYEIIGFDVSQARIDQVSKQYRDATDIRFTTDPKDLSEAVLFLVSVPTLLLPDNSVDTSYIQSALSTIGNYAQPGSTIVVESSVAVGMTRQLLGPLAAEKHLFAGMSPERVDPGRTEPPARSIPKVVSGLDDIVPGSLDAVIRLYAPVFDTLVPVSQPEVAEMTKLYENCQRMMCIAFANEMADACIPHNIDPFEVCLVAATKPFGYLPFSPSLGVGGHCIPVNPYYLLSNSSFPLLQAATEAMKRRPADIAQRVLARLGCGEKANGETKRRILVVGVGFKRGQATLSNSPGLALLKSLAGEPQVETLFADALVPQSAVPDVKRLGDDEWSQETLQSFDAIVVAVKQVDMDFGVLDSLKGVYVEHWCL